MTSVQIKRGTRAQLDAASSAAALKVGEPYLISDEQKLAVGLSATAYTAAMRDDQIVVSATAPANPFLNQIWIAI